MLLVLIGGITACNDQLEVVEPEQPDNLRFWRFRVRTTGSSDCLLQPYSP
jgi:hypothetical protein